MAEAAASDDVSSVESARAYIEARLSDLAEAVPAEAAEGVRAATEAALAGWLDAPVSCPQEKPCLKLQ